jgi:hypothetical protein
MVIVRITTTMNDREAEQVNWPSDAARADAINVRRSCSLPAALGFGGAPIRRRPGGAGFIRGGAASITATAPAVRSGPVPGGRFGFAARAGGGGDLRGTSR